MLPAPARYTPWDKGIYEVAPNLRAFRTDFGNGTLDEQVFQFDTEFEKYRKNKLAAQSRKSLYVGDHNLSDSVANAAAQFLIGRLLEEHPNHFWIANERLECTLTGESVDLALSPRQLLDALLLQVQEDIAIVVADDLNDWVTYINVSAPSHWDPSTKLGMSFFDGHSSVPGFDRINRAAYGLVQAMILRGPWVRFVWSCESDTYLDHHPISSPGHDPAIWDGRQFHLNAFSVRTDRQVVWGLPEVNAALFFMRVSFVRGEDIKSDEALLTSLATAVGTMSPEALRYKGLDRELTSLLRQFAD